MAKYQIDKIFTKNLLAPASRVATVARALLETGNDNWLNVKRSSDGAIISLSKYCRVKNISFSGSGSSRREKFTIIDWPHANVVADVTALPDSRSRFGDVSFNVGAALDYDYQTKKLTVNPGGIVVGAGFDPSNQLANGEYSVFLPDAPHAGGNGYLHLTSHALTWFFIADTDQLDRYVHVGTFSAGCLTVGENGTDADRRRWTDIATTLLVQRATDDRFVGKLVVKGL